MSSDRHFTLVSIKLGLPSIAISGGRPPCYKTGARGGTEGMETVRSGQAIQGNTVLNS